MNAPDEGPTVTKTEARRLAHQENTLQALGVTREHAEALRRISIRLQHWHELECGNGYGCIERDEETNKPYWLNSSTMRRSAIRDLETGARKRLQAIMAQYPELSAYVQGDPRGAALYILRPGDVPEGQDVHAYYSRGICVY